MLHKPVGDTLDPVTLVALSSEGQGPACCGRCAPQCPDVYFSTQGNSGGFAGELLPSSARTLLGPSPHSSAGCRQGSAREVLWVPEMSSCERLKVQPVPDTKGD